MAAAEPLRDEPELPGSGVASNNGPVDSAAEFVRLAAQQADAKYELHLYVSGMTPRSTEAVNNLRAICEQCFSDASQYDLQIIDLYKHPELAILDQVIATPTLVKRQPGAIRRIIGTLNDRALVLAALNLERR